MSFLPLDNDTIPGDLIWIEKQAIYDGEEKIHPATTAWKQSWTKLP